MKIYHINLFYDILEQAALILGGPGMNRVAGIVNGNIVRMGVSRIMKGDFSYGKKTVYCQFSMYGADN